MRQDIARLVKLIEDSNAMYPWPETLPEGAHLRMHPGVPYILYREPDLAINRPAGSTPLDHMTRSNKLPVRFYTAMEPGTWQLMLGEGKLEG